MKFLQILLRNSSEVFSGNLLKIHSEVPPGILSQMFFLNLPRVHSKVSYKDCFLNSSRDCFKNSTQNSPKTFTKKAFRKSSIDWFRNISRKRNATRYLLWNSSNISSEFTLGFFLQILPKNISKTNFYFLRTTNSTRKLFRKLRFFFCRKCYLHCFRNFTIPPLENFLKNFPGRPSRIFSGISSEIILRILPGFFFSNTPLVNHLKNSLQGFTKSSREFLQKILQVFLQIVPKIF